MTIDRRDFVFGAITVASGVCGASEPSALEKERVQGIGGMFFRSRDPKTLAAWYKEHLGIDPTPVDYNQPVWHQSAGPTIFAPFPSDTNYFGSPQQAWMINFRVRSLDAMVRQLRASNIEIKVDTEKYPNGRFARLHDPEGNPIELWEPA
jgi:glyoxylase I family protein